ncbi:hypothetical protein AB4144_59590, partial [Rhizobiaceae sp. 2RAB30]
ERARAAGVDIDLVSGVGMIHVWPLIDMPEARRARDRMVAFLRGTGADGTPSPMAPVRTAPSA